MCCFGYSIEIGYLVWKISWPCLAHFLLWKEGNIFGRKINPTVPEVYRDCL